MWLAPLPHVPPALALPSGARSAPSWCSWFSRDCPGIRGLQPDFLVLVSRVRHARQSAAVRAGGSRPAAPARHGHRGNPLPATIPGGLRCRAGALLHRRTDGVSRLSVDGRIRRRVPGTGLCGGRLGGQFLRSCWTSCCRPFRRTISPLRAPRARSRYWPGFALLLAPFAWLGVPWAQTRHQRAYAARGTGWPARFPGRARLRAGRSPCAGFARFRHLRAVVLLDAGAPVLRLLYALLLLRPTAARRARGLRRLACADAAQPAPHLLPAVAFVAWLIVYARRSRCLPLLAGLPS